MTVKTSRYSKEELTHLISLWNNAVPLKEIASELNRSNASIKAQTRSLRERGVIRSRRVTKNFVQQEAQRVVTTTGCPLRLAERLIRECGPDSEAVERLAKVWVDQGGRCVYSGANLSPLSRGRTGSLVEWIDDSPHFAARTFVEMRKGFNPNTFLEIIRVVYEYRIAPLLSKE